MFTNDISYKVYLADQILFTVFVCVHMCICMPVYVYLCVHMSICPCVHVCISPYVHMFVSVCVYMYTDCVDVNRSASFPIITATLRPSCTDQT